MDTKKKLITKRKKNIKRYEKYKADGRVRYRRRGTTKITVDLRNNIERYENEIAKGYTIINNLQEDSVD